MAGVTTVREIERYPWPDPLDPGRFTGLRERADAVVHGEGRGFVAERMSSGMWEHAMWLRGYEQFYADMVLEPELVHAIMSKELELKMAYWGRVIELPEGHTVIISEADDLGGQDGLLVSLEMYKELIWPYHKRLFEFLKGKARDEMRRRIEDLAPGGGFVFAPIHVVQGGVPPENIMAWWETLQEYGSGVS